MSPRREGTGDVPARRNPCWIVLRPYSVAAVVVVGHQVVVVGHQVAVVVVGHQVAAVVGHQVAAAAVVGHQVAAVGAGHNDALTVRESASLSRSAQGNGPPTHECDVGERPGLQAR